MIVGLFLRHYKIYKGANYIPFGTKNLENLNLFIGPNGAGKSSILEALDTYFNNKDFIIHTGEKVNEAFVAPLILIEKTDIDKFSKSSQAALPIISEFLMTVAESQSINYKPYTSFFSQQKMLKRLTETHYIFFVAFWPQSERNEEVFITFDNLIKRKLKDLEEFNDNKKISKLILDLKHDILHYFSYLYIPVETSIQEFLKLESKGMQSLMSEDVKKHIEKTLNSKSQINGKSQNILDIVNSDLEAFIEKVEKTIQEIDPTYDFQKEYKSKTNITANHLTDVLIETYFQKRHLKRAKKPIKNLSAGERKKALIDIAYAFLIQDMSKDKKVVLAIDEPESSLHISMCYDQFHRLENLSNKYDTQLLVTSHWYGSLPIIEKGNLFHIENDSAEVTISQYSFRNYFEENNGNTNDVQFKSFFDLASAVISSLRIKENNWLIVESEEDKNYILKHLNPDLNLKVLPVGGSAIVKLLYNYLFTPISHKSEKKELLGKVFCLIDTDFQGIGTLDLPNEKNTNKTLRIRRLQVDEKQEIILHKLETDIKFPTEVEETLIPEPFYLALKESIENIGDVTLKNTFEKFAYDEHSKNSFIKGDNSIIYSTATDGKNPNQSKKEISLYIDKNKKDICERYCNMEISIKPLWISELEKFYT